MSKDNKKNDFIQLKAKNNWSSEDKFQMVLETAILSETQRAAYCREKDISVDEIKAWKEQCLKANQVIIEKPNQLKKTLKEERALVEIATLREIVNAINEGVVLVNAKYEIIYFNRQYAEIFDIPEDLIQDENYNAIKQYVKNILFNTEQLFIDESNSSISFKGELKNEITTKDGRCFIRKVISLEKFQLKGLLYRFQEITKEKAYENLLQENQKRYQRLLNNIPDIVLLHSDFKCVYANYAAVQCLGYENYQDLLGKDLTRFFSKDIVHFLQNIEKEILEEIDLGDSLEFKIISKNNHLRWVKLISCSKFHKSKKIWMSVFRDVSEKKFVIESQRLLKEREEKLEEDQKSNQIKYEFFTNLSHELKTPIHIISAASYMLGVDIKEYSEKAKKYMDIIDVNCKRLTRGLNNFIDLEKIELGYFKMSMEVCNIIEIIENITLSVIPYTQVKEIELEFDTNIEEKYMAVDISFIERIILNLLSNAIKFTKAKGRIWVSLKDVGKKLEITIQDTGVGIAQENLSYIFERFSQESFSYEHNPRGSGLGLYLVKNMVEMMKGSIYVDSEIGKGTIFTIILPVYLSQTDQIKVLETSQTRNFTNNKITELELSDIKNT